MGTVIISHLAPAQEEEIVFLLDLAEAFRWRGHRPVIWSAIYDKRFAPYYLPLSWRLKELELFYADVEAGRDAAFGVLDRRKWAARIDELAKQSWDSPDRSTLLNGLASVSQQILDVLNPSLLLSWNTLCPHTGVLADLCRARGVPAMLIERAVFPNTWFIEPGGLLGHSVLAGVPIEDLVSPDERDAYAETGRAYLDRISFGKYTRYAQVNDSSAMAPLLSSPLSERRPRVAFFPPDDGSLGFCPPEHPDREASLPHYTSSFDAARALSHAHDGITVFKPHPSFLEKRFDPEGCPNLRVIDFDYRKLIAWSDVVASTGSGLEFAALAMGKPLVLQGNDLLVGKGVAHEALDPEALPGAVAAAAARKDFDRQIESFHVFTGYLLRRFLVSGTNAPEDFRKADDIAEECCAGPLRAASQTMDGAGFDAAREALLTETWRRKLARESAAPARKPAAIAPDTRPEAALKALRADGVADAVIDFDHTLFLDNSTDRYLDSVRPRILAFFVCMLSDAFTAFCARRRWCRQDRWRDFMRVLACGLLMPWSVIWWRMTARSRMESLVNRDLTAALLEGKPGRIIVLTFGFRHLVRPLLTALPVRTELVSSRVFPWPRNLRKQGKLAALDAALPEERRKEAVFVTDSEDDREVLAALPKSYLVAWGAYTEKAFANLYFPLRYTVQGKYTRRRYFKNQILKEDFLILLLAYGFSGWNWAALAALFLSLYCVYEMGHHANDHRAAPEETAPTLAPESGQFSAYPIQRGWIWAAAFGFIGVACARPEIVAAMMSGRFTALGGLLWALGTWAAVLGALYLCFVLFNRQPVHRRVYVFPVLHLFKTCAYAALLPLTLVGALLLFAQVACQTTNYVIYRYGGKTARFNRQAFRMVYLAGLLVPAGIALPGLWAQAASPRGAAIAAWGAFRIAERSVGANPRQLAVRGLRWSLDRLRALRGRGGAARDAA